jgi:hypothetical protein
MENLELSLGKLENLEIGIEFDENLYDTFISELYEGGHSLDLASNRRRDSNRRKDSGGYGSRTGDGRGRGRKGGGKRNKNKNPCSKGPGYGKGGGRGSGKNR